VSLDVGALLATQRAIAVARADYDYDRDGGAVGPIALNSEVIPSGSIILGGSIHVTDEMTFDTTGEMWVWVGPTAVGQPPDGPNEARSWWWYDLPAVVTDAARALVAFISNDVCTAGKFTIWLYYLPTTG
jgi:hypothetical protein